MIWKSILAASAALTLLATGPASADMDTFLHGFNYVRLNDPEGGKHTTFAPESFDLERAEGVLDALHTNGFNCVRVFISSDQSRPGSLFPDKETTQLSVAYIDNFTQFLRLAQARNIGVIPSFEYLPLNPRYLGSERPEPSHLRYVNRMLLDPQWIRARQDFLADFVGAIKSRDPDLLRAITAYDIQNELCFHMTYPFDQEEGTFTAPNGTTYDLASQKTELADDAAIHWVNAMCAAIREEDPKAKVVTTVFSYHSVRRSGPGDFAPKTAAWQNRYPFRPLALTRSQADYVSIHLYPRDANEFRLKLDSVEFEELKNAAANQGKGLWCTEFGVNKKATPDPVRAAAWAKELQQLIIDNGFAGCLFWQYDTAEQPQWWTATADHSRILTALATPQDKKP